MERLKVELCPLWRAGRVDLPNAAGVLREADKRLAYTHSDNPAWQSLRGELHAALNGTAGRLESAGRDLLTAVAAYAGSDARAAQALDALRDADRGRQR